MTFKKSIKNNMMNFFKRGAERYSKYLILELHTCMFPHIIGNMI